MNIVYNKIVQKKTNGKKSVAVLIDPDNITNEECKKLVLKSVENNIDFIFVGGSLISSSNFSSIIKVVKNNSTIPVLIFPGSNLHIDNSADSILLLSLISGRNADLLIGQHVLAAPILKNSGLEIISTGYILVDGGKQTTVSYISNTTPIPHDKPSIAACTAMAGEMLGLKLVFLDCGSGSIHTVSSKMISAVKNSITLPIVVGGGINSKERVEQVFSAGADVIVVGNEIEKNPNFIDELGQIVKLYNK